LTAIKSFHSTYGGIFHYVSFSGIDQLIGTLAHNGRFMESRKDQFKFSGIGVYVANGIYPGDIGLIIVRIIYLDGIFLYFQAPIPNRPEFRRKSEQRNKKVRFHIGFPLFLVVVLYYYRFHVVVPVQADHLRSEER